MGFFIGVPIMLDNESLIVFQLYHSRFLPNLTVFSNALTSDEQLALRKLKSEAHQRSYIISRYCCRLFLAMFNAVDRRSIVYRTEPRGKPYAVNKSGEPYEIQFNLSHSNELCLLVFGKSRKLGVDVEYIDSGFDREDVINTYFSIDEREHINNCSHNENIERFYQMWTLKEAYLKSTGVGIIDNLADYSVQQVLKSKSSLLQPLQVDKGSYKAAIACDNPRFKIKSLGACDSFAFIEKLIQLQ